MKQENNGIDKVTLASLMQLLEKSQNVAAAKPEAEKPKPANKEKTSEAKEPKQQPAMTFLVGNVSTRIWANRNDFGQISWSVDQRRTRLDGWGAPAFKSFHPEHLQDAMRGLYKAQCWIKKMERRLRWSRLFL